MKRKAGSLVVVAAVIALMLASCLKTEENSAEVEQQNIENFLGNNPDINFTKTESGLYYYVVEPGAGDVIRAHDTAKVFYLLQSLGGVFYDSNVGQSTYNFPVGENKNIPGFDEGVSMMKEGGKSLFLVPSSLAYGAAGSGIIMGYTPLLFEVELAGIGRGPGK